MNFVRKQTSRWHKEVPGSRWFKADLHVHTVDDLPGRRVKMPGSVQGDPLEPAVLRQYARFFLEGVVQMGVQVVGLTPHSPRLGDAPDTSAVWHIVDAWNSLKDTTGVPFREKIYAIFPGFEPNVRDGSSGVHLLFLFDPEIGREAYLSLFEALMNAKKPWKGGSLRLTSRDAKRVFEIIDERQQESLSTNTPWSYLVLAPHFQNRHGLLWEVKSQVLESFPCTRLAGYELGDEKLPEDFNESEKPGSFLLPFMREHRQAFFHASDAYKVSAGEDVGEQHVGHRTTWVKLASPRIEALRQSFIASESRLRTAYERGKSGSLLPLPEPPDPLKGKRPWLRSVSVRGSAAFFGGQTNQEREVKVELSPDLTCIIGGSMTGKSTLLDGLRMHLGMEMPSNERLREQVEIRGRDIFLAGQPEVQLDTPGGGTEAANERWPAVFFTQNELQRLAQDPAAVEELLVRLVPSEQASILERAQKLKELDRNLTKRARKLERLMDQRGETQQQLTMACEAKQALDDFEAAGLAKMQSFERLQGKIDRASERSAETSKQIEVVRKSLLRNSIDQETERDLLACHERMNFPVPSEGLGRLYTRAIEAVELAADAVKQWAGEVGRALDVANRAVAGEREAVQRRLAGMGHGAEKLAEFNTLSQRAGMLTSYEDKFKEIEDQVQKERIQFEDDRVERGNLVDLQRKAFERIKQAVEQQFERRIRVRRINHGVYDKLERFLQGLRQKGITQWWNALASDRRPSPEQLFKKLQAGSLTDLGVSSIVEERFLEVFSEANHFKLRALRSPDSYVLELRVGDNDYREAERLSGGRRVSLLLSLLLEAHDDRPLVIDQPEDELDNTFLWGTVLPALRRLKGKRQVIVATHDANIVVNGDADLVVQLEADAKHGRVAVSGAIEDSNVRTAILETVDGGKEAFELRKTKYGF